MGFICLLKNGPLYFLLCERWNRSTLFSFIPYPYNIPAAAFSLSKPSLEILRRSAMLPRFFSQPHTFFSHSHSSSSILLTEPSLIFLVLMTDGGGSSGCMVVHEGTKVWWRRLWMYGGCCCVTSLFHLSLHFFWKMFFFLLNRWTRPPPRHPTNPTTQTDGNGSYIIVVGLVRIGPFGPESDRTRPLSSPKWNQDLTLYKLIKLLVCPKILVASRTK